MLKTSEDNLKNPEVNKSIISNLCKKLPDPNRYYWTPCIDCEVYQPEEEYEYFQGCNPDSCEKRKALMEGIFFDANSVLLEASVFKSLPVTDNPFFSAAFALIAKNASKTTGFPEEDKAVAEGIMNLELPIISDPWHFEALGKLRSEEEQSFRQFRQQLRILFSDLESANSQSIRKRAKQISKDIILPNLKSLDDSYKRLKHRAELSGFALGLSTIPVVISAITAETMGLLTSGLQAIVSGLSLASDVTSMNQLKDNQLYFLWKLTGDSCSSQRRNR